MDKTLKLPNTQQGGPLQLYGNVESCRELKSVDWALLNRRHLKTPKITTAKPQTQHCKSVDSILQNRRHPMKCNQDSTLKNQDSPKNFINWCFTLQFALTADEKYCKTIDPMKCNQLGFCLGISSYSTLQNRRQSKEFHSLIVFHGISTVLQYL